MTKELTELEVNRIREQAREKLGVCRKSNEIIGTQVFSILGLYARVLYYPLGKNAPWGFTRIRGTENGVEERKPFVALNTSITLPCQVFAAAHELYHIWYETESDVLPSDLLTDAGEALNEKMANRFAAEFLADELLLRREMATHGMKEINVKEVLQLSEIFMLPYKAMLKRLCEVGIISRKEYQNLLLEDDNRIDRYIKMYAIYFGTADNRIALDNLAELSVRAYDKGLITFEKLEYLLNMCELKPKELGIEKAATSAFPSEEELDDIMGENE